MAMAMAMVTQINPLGMQNVSINLGIGGKFTDSNIDYHDTNENFIFLTKSRTAIPLRIGICPRIGLADFYN